MVGVGRGAFMGALFFYGAVVAAEGLSVNPVRVEFGAGQRAVPLTVTNETDEPKVIQASIVHWKQPGNEPTYDPAKDLLVTPVLFRVPPNSSQLVRVGFAGVAPDAGVEHAYRLFLEEVPQGAANQNEVRMLLRFGIPVFVPPAKPQDAFDWQLRVGPGGRVVLALSNRGNRHIRVDAFRLGPAKGPLSERRELSYALAGGRHEWALEMAHPPAPGSRVHLHAETDRGILDAELTAVH